MWVRSSTGQLPTGSSRHSTGRTPLTATSCSSAARRTPPQAGSSPRPSSTTTDDPEAFTLSESLGPLLTVHVYDDSQWDTVLGHVDRASGYALTLSIFASDRRAISQALDVLRNTAGMTYINNKPTGALMGQVSFGGGRASGTKTTTRVSAGPAAMDLAALRQGVADLGHRLDLPLPAALTPRRRAELGDAGWLVVPGQEVGDR